MAVGQTPSPTPAPKAAAVKPAAPPAVNSKIKRWFELDQLAVATRYHFIQNANHTKAANNVQYQFIAKGRFKFDAKGRYIIAAQLATGSSFTTLWNATGWGTGSYQKDLNLRQLYFAAKPVKPLEIQIGGLYVNYGDLTQAITYDDDGYITGERVQLRLPKKVYFDEISVTYGRLADANRPNVFERFKRFDKQNYHQFLVRKQFNKSVSLTADYSFESGIDTFHQAIKFKLPAKQMLDTLLIEQYERVDPDRNYGFNLFGEKKLNKMFTASGGFADIHIRALNADRFPPGKRVYLTGQMKLSPEFSMSLQLTQGVGPILPTVHRTRVDFAITYNILETLHRLKLF
jgi:hypothetical protein